MTTMEHWSATRFMAYDICPAEFRARYVEHQPVVETEAMAFGKCVHLGLEEHFRGGNGERVFRSRWKEYVASASSERSIDPKLTAMGLTLLDLVFDLQLEGEPERAFSLDTIEIGAPTVGAVDLWGKGRIYDFKTTLGRWSQERAQKELWQPCLYTWAYWDATDTWPEFEYIVLNRATGTLSRFVREWTKEEYMTEVNYAWARMGWIAKRVADDDLACHGNHGYCLECGDRWSHEHDCHPATGAVRGRR